MPHQNHPTNYTVGLNLQTTAMQELRNHAHQLVSALPFITDDVGELLTKLDELSGE
jgi:hypothetical protein